LRTGHHVESKTVKVKFFEPIDRILNKEPANHLGIVRIKIECGAPRGVMLGIKIIWRVIAEIVSIRAQVVIDSV